MNSDFDPDLVDSFFREYKDRGMVKWQGYYLSDHTAKLGKKKKKESEIFNRQHLDQMDENQIVSTVNKAISKQNKVEIELNYLSKNGYIPKKVCGYILGTYNNKLLIDKFLISLDEIYRITIVTTQFHNE